MVELFAGVLDGSILEQADPLRMEGFPMESLFFVDEYGLLLGHIQGMKPDDKMKWPTHRQRLLEAVAARLSAIGVSL